MSDLFEEHTVYSEAQRAHRNLEDFSDGDIGERIEKFTHFQLTEVCLADLTLDEWAIDDDLVDEYAAMSPETAPPIIYDAVERSIIDGTHRANAAAKRGG